MAWTKVCAALAAILSCSVVRAANLLSVTPSVISLSCNTVSGPASPATIVVKPATALTTNTIAVTAQLVLGTGVVITPPQPAILTAANQSQGLSFSVNLAAGCAGVIGNSATIRFYAGGASDVSATAALSVTATASALSASPISLSCFRNSGMPVSYTPGPAQTVAVTSAAAGGTPFSVDSASLPAWLTVTPPGGTAGPAGIGLTFAPSAPCGSFAMGSSNTVSIHLRNAPAPDALIPVTLHVFGPSPLAAAPVSPSLTYGKGSSTPASVDVTLSAGSATPAFAVDPASLPPWLTVDVTGGTAPKTLHFTTTSVADAIAQGTYSAAVHVQTAGFADLVVPFSLTVNNPAATLTVEEGTTRNLAWTLGQPLPAPYITLASSGSPIPYSISTGGTAGALVSSVFAKGLAYSYGTPIPVTFDPNVFAQAQAGTVLTGIVTIAWGTPSTATAVTLKIAIQSAGATVLAVSPRSIPTAGPGETFTVSLIGTGFVASPDATQQTQVGIVSGGQMVADANLAATVVNSSNIIVVFTVPAKPDPLLPFDQSGPGGSVTLGICNPLGTVCATPTGVAILAIGAIPVVRSVTSASSYLQVAPALPVVAPYDMVSLFGFNFCTSRGTGCLDKVLYAALDPATLRYPTSLTPDSSGAARRLLIVTFQTHATPPVVIANAPLLFATDGQINLLVPSGVVPYIGKSIDIVVNFGSFSGDPVTVNVVAADPGIFAVGSDGQGEGAILGADWSMITTGNEAGMRQIAADSDTVQIFVTGLGAPDSTADNGMPGQGVWPADCVTTGSFLTSLNLLTSGSFTSLDGAVIAGAAINNGRIAPCLKSSVNLPAVTIGGQPATLLYAGWLPGSVEGLYQVNVRLPGSAAGPFVSASGAPIAFPLTAPVQLPVVVTARGRASQPGVTVWVAPKLKVTGPSGAALQGTAGVKWPVTGSLVTASEGKSPYLFSVTGGSLPGGLTLNGASGVLSGTPAANAAGTYTVTVTATDSADQPLTGSATFTLVVNAGH